MSGLPPVFAVAKKEILDNIRSRWVIVLSVIFAVLTLVMSYYGSLGSDWQSLSNTIAGMMVLVQYLISIIGLMLGYSAINGDVESGTMLGVLALPLKRAELLMGKFLGLGFVGAVSILVGFGFSGVIIGLNVPGADFIMYLGFICASVLYCLVFIAIGLLISSLVRQRNLSMGLSIFTWFFFTMIWSIIMLPLAFGAIVEIQDVPSWYYGVNLINPMNAFNSLVSLNVTSVAAPVDYPSWYSTPLLVGVLVIWILACFLLSWMRFEKMDI